MQITSNVESRSDLGKGHRCGYKFGRKSGKKMNTSIVRTLRIQSEPLDWEKAR